MFEASREASGALGALGSAALVSPAEEAPKLGALAPEKPEELPGIEILGFSSEECLHPPLQIRAVPGIQAVALGSRPVITQRAQHADILHHALGELFRGAAEKFLNNLPAGAFDHPLPDRRNQTADLGLAGIGHFGLAFFRGQLQLAASGYEPGQAFAFQFQSERVRRIFIRELNRTGVGSGNGGKPKLDDRFVAVGTVRVEPLASRQQLGQPLRVVQKVPDLLRRSGQERRSGNLHFLLPFCAFPARAGGTFLGALAPEDFPPELAGPLVARESAFSSARRVKTMAISPRYSAEA